MVNDTLQDNRVPSFTVKIVCVVFLRCNDWDMAPINCASALREAPSLFEAFYNLLQFISLRQLYVLRHENMSNCPAKLVHNGANGGLGYSKEVGYGAVTSTCCEPIQPNTDVLDH